MKDFTKRQPPLKAETGILQQLDCPMDGKVAMYRTYTSHRISTMLFLCIMAALFSQGYSLNCTKCSGSKPDCTGSPIKCSSQYDVCSTKISIFTAADESEFYVSRACAKSQSCGWSITTSFNSGSTLEGASCCPNDGCTPPAQDFSPNGLKCPALYSPPETKSPGTVDCAGDQYQCFNYTNTQTTGNRTVLVNILGCANEVFCQNYRSVYPSFASGNVKCVKVTAE